MGLDFDVQSAVMSLVRSSIMTNSLTKTLSRRDTSFESTGCLSRTWCGIWYDSLLYQRTFYLSTLICKTKVSNSHIVLDYTSSLTETMKRKYGRWAFERRVRETRRRVKAPGDNKCQKYKKGQTTNTIMFAFAFALLLLPPLLPDQMLKR